MRPDVDYVAHLAEESARFAEVIAEVPPDARVLPTGETATPRLTSTQPPAAQPAARRATPTGQNCVEVATNLSGIVAVRDSMDPSGPTLLLYLSEWRSFLDRMKGPWP